MPGKKGLEGLGSRHVGVVPVDEGEDYVAATLETLCQRQQGGHSGGIAVRSRIKPSRQAADTVVVGKDNDVFI